MTMSREWNVDGVFGARFGYYYNKRYLFTHRDPKTGMLWTDDILDGGWVPAEEVRLV